MTQKWIIDYGPLRAAPNGGKLLDLPVGVIVTPTGGEQTLTIGGHPTLWAEIVFGGRNGWVNAAYLEDYLEKFPTEVSVTAATPDPNDAAQYMIVEGDVKNNLCGQFCVAFIVGDSSDNLLVKWKQNLPDAYQATIGGTTDKGTWPGALEAILKLYGKLPEDILPFKAGLTDPLIGYQPSPGRFAKMLQTHQLIAGVNIDSETGRLRGSGVGHWVVLDKITPVGRNSGNGGWVELYNPFPNRREEYSYDEFTASCGGVDNWDGRWVRRNIQTAPGG
jgi:hypothetical protein